MCALYVYNPKLLIDAKRGAHMGAPVQAGCVVDRLGKQIEFVKEIDGLKEILRQSLIMSGGRRENTAEHSWHLAMMVMTLSEHSNEPIDVAHTMKLVLNHDIVEIDAGDTFAYDVVGYEDKEEREQKAADR